MDEIVNRVAKSKVEVIDLQDLYPSNPFSTVDISQWMEQGLLLKEKDFRNLLQNYCWEQYKNHFVHIYCSTEAIVPTWAFLLVGVYLEPFASKVVLGDIDTLRNSVWEDIINDLSFEKYYKKRVVVKGCGKKFIPLNAYVNLINKLKNSAKSILFGEICSAVPLFKSQNK